jgi:hypothetical protein
MKLGPLGVPGWVAPFLALEAEAELPVDCVWLDEELLCFVWELAAAFLPCVADVAVRFEALLPALPDDLAAVRLALLLELLLEEPLEPPLLDSDDDDADEDEELPELAPVLDELDEDAAGGVAALGGGGATGVERMESSATRSYSLRPDAL